MSGFESPDHSRRWPQASTTMDEPTSVLLRLIPDEDGYIVSDCVGLRHGDGMTVEAALTAWARHVAAILSYGDDELGEPLLSEVRKYRRALGWK